MRSWKDQNMTPDIMRLITMIRNKEVVLWAGSGLSLYAGYPSGAEFCNIILNAAKNETDKQILSNHKTVLMNIAEEYEQLYSREELVNLVSAHFDKPPEVNLHTHELCAQIPQIDTIITTNYDHLFECVYGDKLRTIVGTQYKPAGKEPVTLYKIHGDTSDSKSIVLTSKDYATFYEGLNSLVWSNLKIILAEHSVLFVGYSLEDKNIEDIFEKVLINIDTSRSEFFIAVPRLAEYKLRHFNSICKTTHLPISGEELFAVLESAIRENIVFDAIDKKISIDQAQAVARKHGVEPTWKSKPLGECTEIEVESYTTTPLDALHKIKGADITSTEETYTQMIRFMDDCDCQEILLPAESVKMFEQINGIKIPIKNLINGKKPNVVKINKTKQTEEAVLTVNGDIIRSDSIKLHFVWGNKRRRVTIDLPSISIFLLWENDRIHITFSFNDKHKSQNALDDLSLLSMWCSNEPMVFCHKNGDSIEPVFQLPPIEDANVSNSMLDFISENTEIYQQIKKVETHTCKELLITSPFTVKERGALLKILSIFEPVNTYGIFNLDFALKCDRKLYESLKQPATGAIDIIETINECVCLFGCEYTIKERKVRVDSPVIDNLESVKSALDAGQEAIAKIVSSTGKLIMQCKC